MRKVGIGTIWVSLLAVIFGLIFGFIGLIKYGEPSFWLAIIPAGFAGLLMGLVMALFSNR